MWSGSLQAIGPKNLLMLTGSILRSSSPVKVEVTLQVAVSASVEKLREPVELLMADPLEGHDPTIVGLNDMRTEKKVCKQKKCQ